MEYLSLLLFSLMCLLQCSITRGQGSGNSPYICYYDQNCGASNPRPVYVLDDSLNDCCTNPHVKSVLNYLANTCHECDAPFVSRITPRITALYPPASLTLEISATGYTSISWFVNGTAMHDFSRLTLENYDMKFTLSDTSLGDVGHYEVDVYMIDGNITILDFIVNAYVPPDITISDPTESNIIGDHVNVTCMSHGYPTPTVSMYCDNFDTISYPNIISEPASFGNELSNVTATLQVNITNVDGLQQCYCIVSVFDGIATSSINDSVLLLATPAMIVNPGPLTQTITAPHILEIACTSHGRPLPDVLWSRNNVLLSSDARINITEQVTGFTRSSTLTILPTSNVDHGMYKCTASNLYGNDTETISIEVQFPPIVTADKSVYNADITVQSKVTLRCEALGNPEAQIIWVGEGGVLNNKCTGGALSDIFGEAALDYMNFYDNFHDFSGDLGVNSPDIASIPNDCSIDIIRDNNTSGLLRTVSLLTISDINLEESSNFICVGDNGIMKLSDDSHRAVITLNIYAPVLVNIAPSMLIHSNGQVNTINCSSTGVPAPTINFVDIQCAYSDTTNITDIISGIFTVRCISERENGLYKVTAVAKITTVTIGGPIELQCRAHNALFHESDTGTISIYVPPQIITDALSQPVVVLVNETFTLTCSITGYPVPIATWSGSNGVLSVNNRVTITTSQITLSNGIISVESQLTVTNVRFSDGGDYICNAINAQDASNKVIARIVVNELPSVVITPPTVTYIKGNATQISCTGVGVPLPSVTFGGITCVYFASPGEAPEVMEGDLFLGYCDITNDRVTVVIEINNATQLGPVEVQCSAENPNGRTPNVSATIDLTSPTSILTPPYNISPISGDNVTLMCVATGYPVPVIKWAYNNIDNVLNNSGVTSQQEGLFVTQSNLSISNIDKFTHEGKYYCIASNDFYPAVSSSANILSIGVVPLIITNTSSQALLVGSSINLTCIATGFPAVNITWTKEGLEIDDNIVTNVTIPAGEVPITTSILSLNNLEIYDEGDYLCAASNVYDSNEKTILHLEVNAVPTVIITPSSVVHRIPSDPTVLTCSGTGNPPPTVTFGDLQCNYGVGNGVSTNIPGVTVICGSNYTVNGLYYITAYYTLNNDLSDYNSYNISCSSTNSLSSITTMATINIQVLQTVRTLPQSVIVPEQETFTVKCIATGYPLPTLDWLYGEDSVSVVFNERRTATSEVVNKYTLWNTLTVKKAVPSDAGEYKCRAQYEEIHMIDSTTVTVEILDDCLLHSNPCVHGICVDQLNDYFCQCSTNYTGKNCSQRINVPFVIPPDVQKNPANITETILLGSFNLTCVASGTSPIYQWKKDNKLIYSDSDAVLTITDAQPQDRGYYTCIAVNDAGNSTSEPGLVIIPGIYQYVAVIDKINTNDIIDVDNTTDEMAECLVYHELPDQNTTIIYSVTSCNLMPCSPHNGLASVLVTVYQRTMPDSDGLRDALWSKLQNLETECKLGVKVIDLWRFDGCRREEEILHSDYDISIKWPESEITDRIEKRCPCGDIEFTIGTATRQCGGTYTYGAVWLPANTSRCDYNQRNINITLTLCHLTTVKDIKEVAEELVEISKDAASFEQVDFSIASLILEKIVESNEIADNEELQNNYVESLSNLLSVDSNVVKASQNQHDTSNRILSSLDTFQNKVILSGPNKTVMFQKEEIAIIISENNLTTFQNQTFVVDVQNGRLLDRGGVMLVENIKLSEAESESTMSLSIPDSLSQKYEGKGPIRISYNVFLSTVFFQASTGYYGQLITAGNLTVGGVVISASVSNKTIENLDDPISITFTKPKYLRKNGTNDSDSTCVFWDFTIGGGSGSWSMRGCRNVSGPNDDVIQCQCDHLTHFGYLLDVKPRVVNTGAIQTSLEVITYIGATVSIFCLILTIITYLGSKKLLKRTQGKTLINMSLVLIGMYVTYLAAGNASSILKLNGGDVFCGFLGALLYYFMLVYFMWTAIEAVDLYRKLVKVFHQGGHFVLYGTIIAWGVPLIITGISAGAGYQYYLEYKFFCRPAGLPFYIGFLVPFGVIYIFDWVLFVIIIGNVFFSKRRRTQEYKSNTSMEYSKILFMAMILSVNFGLGWAFGLLATAEFPEEVYLTFVYLFSIFVGVQGILIFLLHCVRANAARQLWKQWLLIAFCFKKPQEAKAMTRSGLTPFATPARPRKFGTNAPHPTSAIPPSKQRYVNADSDGEGSQVLKNPIHGMSEAETVESFIPSMQPRLSSPNEFNFDVIDIGKEIVSEEVEQPDKPKKKMSKQQSKKRLTKTKLSSTSSLKSKQKAKAKPELEDLVGSTYSLGDMSLSGSQALEIEFGPSPVESEEEEEEWKKLEKQFDNIHVLISESFVDEAETSFTGEDTVLY